MTESSRHSNSVARVVQLVKELGHQLWINCQDGGRDGYKFPVVVCGDDKPRPFIADTLFRTQEGAMVAVEVFLNHETTKWKKKFYQDIGTAFIETDPDGVDRWVKEPELLQRTIDWAIRQLWKPEISTGTRKEIRH